MGATGLGSRLGSNWVERFFFYGHLGKGTIYVLLGGLTVAALVGGTSRPDGYADVMRWVQDQPLGNVLLLLLAAGMFGYCAWRWTKAVLDVEHDGWDAKGALKRIGSAVSGTSYGLLGVGALTMAMGSSSGGSSKRSLIATVLEQSWGPLLIIAAAATVLIIGAFQLRRGLRDDFMKRLDVGTLSARAREAVRNLGRAGHVARAVVYGIVAYFLVRVALTENPAQFRGTGGALEYLAQGYGAWLLALVSIGLLLYGAFMYVVAAHRRPITV